MLSLVLFLVGLIFLLKGADFLVDGAVSIAKKKNISDFIIGLTICSFGTSAPELFVSLFANIQGHEQIALGNVIGSNLMNLLLVLGLSALFTPIVIHHKVIFRELPFSILAVIVLLLIVNDRLIDTQSFSIISRIDSGILLCFFVIFLYYLFSSNRSNTQEVVGSYTNVGMRKAILYVTLGAGALMGGSHLVVRGAIDIAKTLSISEDIVGLVMTSIGTSLPELVTSVMAAYKNKPDLAIGNVIGSNIFNIFLVLGVTSLVSPIHTGRFTNIDLLVLLLASVGFFALLLKKSQRKLSVIHGLGCITFYSAYLIFLYFRS